MPIAVSPQGWVKVPKPAPARRGPPPDPVDVFRGTLEYFAGRRDPKPMLPPPTPFPPKRRRQLLLEAPPQEIPAPPLRKQKSRVASEPAPRKHKPKRREEIYEVADEEIIREDFHDSKSVYSRRSASPVRKNRHASARHDDHRHGSERGTCDHYPHPHPYPPQPYPGMHPFAMYYQAPPPMMYPGGFGGGYGGHFCGGGAMPAMIQGPEYTRERTKKSPAASTVGSTASSNINYKWHNATRPLKF